MLYICKSDNFILYLRATDLACVRDLHLHACSSVHKSVVFIYFTKLHLILCYAYSSSLAEILSSLE